MTVKQAHYTQSTGKTCTWNNPIHVTLFRGRGVTITVFSVSKTVCPNHQNKDCTPNVITHRPSAFYVTLVFYYAQQSSMRSCMTKDNLRQDQKCQDLEEDSRIQVPE